MSQRLREMFARCRETGRPAFMPYVTAGYPTRADTVPILLAMQAGGADGIELGVPFTDPLADGATIQHANQVALQQGLTFAACIELVSEARASGLTAPVLLLGYDNPILAYGEEEAARDAAAAGADGFIVVDLPPEEAAEFIAACRAHGLSFVPLVAPTTTDSRLPTLAASADAFLYSVSVTGTTGERAALPPDLPEFLGRIRKHTSLPLGVGFGISRPEHVQAVGRIAEAAIVGSAVIAAIDGRGKMSPAQAVQALVESLRG